MESKLKSIFADIKLKDNKLKILIALGLIGVLLIAMSEFLPEKKKAEVITDGNYTYYEYISNLEEKTEALISSVNGVGRCKVMITLKDTNESIYAKNTDENTSESSYSKSDEYVLYEGQGGREPVLLKQRFPEIQGVAVVCDGADDTRVRESIVNSISSLYGVSASKISISKYKG